MPLNEYEFPASKVANVQNQLEMLMEKNYYLHRSAKDAYRSYLQSYASHSHKNVRRAAAGLTTPSVEMRAAYLIPARQIFDVDKLDLAKVARSFGFTVPPNVNLGVHSSKEGKVQARGGGGGFGGGYRDADDKAKVYRKPSIGHGHGHGKDGGKDKRQYSR